MIRKLLRKLGTTGSATSDFFSLASGSALVVVIQFIFTPILSRIFLPEVYGVFAIYSALLNNIVIFSTLGLKDAIILPKNKFLFYSLLRLNFVVIAVSFCLWSLVVILWGPQIVGFLQAPHIGIAVFAIPLVAAVSAVIELLASWYIKTGDFKTGPVMRVARNLISRITSVGYGLALSKLWWGLLAGDVISRLFAVIYLSRRKFWRLLRILFSSINAKKLRHALLHFKQFVAYRFPSNILSNWVGQMPLYLTGIFFGSQYVGYLGFATSLLFIPINLVGNSLSTVFYQRLAQLQDNDFSRIGYLTQLIVNRLMLLSIIPLAVLVAFGDQIFSVFLGKEWMEAGNVASRLGFYYAMYLLYSSLSSIFMVLKMQRYLLWVQVLHLIVVGISFLIGSIYNDVLLTFLVLGILGSIPFLMALLTIYHKLRLPLKYFLYRLLLLTLILAIVWFGRYAFEHHVFKF